MNEMHVKVYEIKDTFEGLPEACWIEHPMRKELVVVKRGVMGFFPQKEDVLPYDIEVKDYLNEGLGVTKAQEKAMEKGSMFGWDVPASNPANYDEEGNYIK